MDELKDNNGVGAAADGVDDSVVLDSVDSGAGEIVGLSGSSVQKIDDKGRFTFPKKLRDLFGTEKDSVIITRGARLGYRHLWAMPKGEWDRLVEKINRMPESNNKMRVSMHFLGGKEECDIDKFGRVLMSAPLREWAKLESGELFITGIGRRIVIIDRKLYEDYLAQEGYDEQIEADVDKLGL